MCGEHPHFRHRKGACQTDSRAGAREVREKSGMRRDLEVQGRIRVSRREQPTVARAAEKPMIPE